MSATAVGSIDDELEQMEFHSREFRRKVEELRQQHSSLIIDTIKNVVTALKIAPQQIYGPLDASTWEAYAAQVAKERPVRRRAPATQKYGDGQGNTWSGRGKRPRWFEAALSAGKTPEDLLIRDAARKRR